MSTKEYKSKVPHSKLWGITGRGTAPPQAMNGAAFLPPASWGVSSGEFYEKAAIRPLVKLASLLAEDNNNQRHLQGCGRPRPGKRNVTKAW